MNELNIYQKLSNIQNEVKVLKKQRNTFGNYNFRSAEDIMEASKPVCAKYDTVIKVSDEIKFVGDRYYVEATAILYDFVGNSVEATASAREADTQKGMNVAQITGSSSSYARKYALGGLLQLDDTKDPDATNKHGKETKPQKKAPKEETYQPLDGARITAQQKDKLIAQIQEGKNDLQDILNFFKIDSLDELNFNQAQQVIAEGNK